MSTATELTDIDESFDAFNHPFELLNEKTKTTTDPVKKDNAIITAFIEPFATNWSIIVTSA